MLVRGPRGIEHRLRRGREVPLVRPVHGRDARPTFDRGAGERAGPAEGRDRRCPEHPTRTVDQTGSTFTSHVQPRPHRHGLFPVEVLVMCSLDAEWTRPLRHRRGRHRMPFVRCAANSISETRTQVSSLLSLVMPSRSLMRVTSLLPAIGPRDHEDRRRGLRQMPPIACSALFPRLARDQAGEPDRKRFAPE